MKVPENRFIEWLKVQLRDISVESDELNNEGDCGLENNNELVTGYLLKLTTTFTPPEFKGKDDVWDKLTSRIDNNKGLNLSAGTNKRRYYIAIAASIAILISVGLYLVTNKTTIRCERGQQKTYLLPD